MAFDDEYLEDELDTILDNPGLDPKTFKAVREVRGFRRKLVNAGVEPADTVPRESLFSKLLDVIMTPQRAVEGVVDSIVNRPDVYKNGIVSGALQAAARGIDEKISGSDILRRSGVENPYARAIVGFTGDVLLDPLTYLTLGGSRAARIGGQAVSEGGLRVAGLINALPENITGGLADDAFKALGRWTRNSKLMKFATTDASRTTLAAKLAQDEQVFKPVLEKVGVGIEKAGELLAPKTVRAGVSLPFLGHFKSSKSALAEISKDPIIGSAIKEARSAWKAKHPIKSAIGSAFSAIGSTVKPARIELFEKEIPEGVLKAFDTIGAYGQQSLAKLGIIASAVADVVPGGGLAKTAGREVKDIVSKTAKAFKNTFARAALYGPDFRAAELDRHAAIAFAEQRSWADTLANFSDYYTDPKRRQVLQEALVDLDAMFVNPLFKAFEEGPLKGQRDDLLKIIQNAARGGVLSPDVVTPLFKAAEDAIDYHTTLASNLDAYMQLPDKAQEVKDAVLKIKSLFDDIFIQEQKAGIRTSYLAGYVPHRYDQIAKASVDLKGLRKLSGESKAGFMAKRSYQTLGDAFKDSGLVGNINIADLYQKRLEASLKLRANRAFFHRLVLENGLPQQHYEKLAKAALADPSGPDAQLLSRMGFAPPTALDAEAIEQGKKLYAQQQSTLSGVNRIKSSGLDNIKDYRNEFSDVLMPNDAARDAVLDYISTSRSVLAANGVKPLDSLGFIPHRGEFGTAVKFGDEIRYLPQEMARAAEELVASRDIIRDMFGGSEIGKKFLRATDAGLNFFKKAVTLPWPSYWAGNLMGDAFFRFADGGLDALDPGVMARLYKTLAGESVFKSKTGQIISAQTLKDAFAQGGIKFSADEMLGVVDAMNDMDVEKYLKVTQKGPIQNLLAGDVMATLTQAQNKARDSFETFMRASHVFHRLEQGDTLSSAVMRANEALLNYRDLTPWEKSVARRVFPFYTWLSKATKKQITSLISSPGDIAVQLKAARGLSEMFSAPDAPPTADEFDVKLLQSVLTNEQIAVPLGKDAQGKTITGRVNALPVNTLLSTISLQAPRSFSVGEIMDASADSAWRTIQKGFAVSNPVIKAAAEKLSGKNLYFNKPLNSAFLRQIPSFLDASQRLFGYSYDSVPADVFRSLDSAVVKFLDGVYVPEKGAYQIDPGKMWVLMQIPGLSRLVSATKNLANPNVPAGQSMLPFFTPIKVSPSSPEETWLANTRALLEQQYYDASVKQRLENQKLGIE